MEDDELDDIKSTPEVLQRFIDQYKDHIEETSFYIEERNWGRKIEPGQFGDLNKEHNIEWNLIKNISDRLAYFIKEAESHLHRAFARNFINKLKDLMEGYINRCNQYRKLNKWSEIADPEYMDKQITFQDGMLKNITDLRKVMGRINVDDAKEETKKIPIHGDKKVPLLMKEIIEKRFPKQFQ